PHTLGIVTGLQFEADIARALPGSNVACYGPGPAAAGAAASTLVAQGAAQLMSFGIAGGLDPDLLCGDLVVSPATLAAQLAVPERMVNTVEAAVLTPRAKSALYAKTGAHAVDMETSAVRAIAQRHNLPFLILRVICDEADDTIPHVALAGVDAEGRTKPLRVARGLAVRPQDLAALITLGNRRKRAVMALKAAVKEVSRTKSAL
ncbi:MAG: hypothetical protein AAF607_17380, partial [Pseudomonadota bacterium]